MVGIKVNADLRENMALALKNEPVVFAYLFGSQAAGRAEKESDVDVAVLLDEKVLGDRKDRFEKRLDLMGVLGEAFGVSDLKMDVVVLNDAPLLLKNSVLFEGKWIYETDRSYRAEFIRQVEREMDDERQYLNMRNEMIISKLAGVTS